MVVVLSESGLPAVVVVVVVVLGTSSNPGRRARGRQPMTRGNGARTPSFGAQSLNLSKQRSRRSGFASLWPLLEMRETC